MSLTHAQQQKLLCFATKFGNDAAVRALLVTGLDPNTTNEVGDSPLHHACHKGYEATVRALLDAGANPNVKDRFGQTPLFNTKHLSILDMLLSAGADPTIANEHGNTPLHQANHVTKSPAIVAVLMRSGANPNIKNWRGDTPLHKACRIGCVPSVKMLMATGADPTIVNNYGETAAYVAPEGRWQFATHCLLKTPIDAPEFAVIRCELTEHRKRMLNLKRLAETLLVASQIPRVGSSSPLRVLHATLHCRAIAELLLSSRLF